MRKADKQEIKNDLAKGDLITAAMALHGMGIDCKEEIEKLRTDFNEEVDDFLKGVKDRDRPSISETPIFNSLLKKVNSL